MQEKEYRGHWWLPTNPDRISGGIATYNPEDGIELNLFSALDPHPQSFNPGQSPQFNRILGVTTDGEAVTLVNTIRVNVRDRTTRHANEVAATHRANYLIDGYHFKHQNLAFDDVRVSFPLLEKWAELASPNYDMDLRTMHRPQPGSKFSIGFQFPDPECVTIDDTEITLSVKSGINIDDYKSGTIDATAYFKIDPRRPRVPFNEFREHIRKLTNFITFGTGRAVQPQFVESRLTLPGLSRAEKIDILYPLSYTPDISGSVHPNSMLFQLSDIRSEFDRVLKQWYDTWESMTPVFDLYFGTQYNPQMYLNNTFLTLTQTIEPYHRQAYGGTYHSEYKYEKIHEALNTILDGDLHDIYGHSGGMKGSVPLSNPGGLRTLHDMFNLDEGLRDSLKGGAFKYGNEYSLDKRLREIINDHEPLLKDLPLNVINHRREIVETRNHLTHYNEEKGDDVVEGAELQRLTWRLQQLVEVCLLTEIGIPASQIKSRLTRRYRERSVSDW